MAIFNSYVSHSQRVPAKSMLGVRALPPLEVAMKAVVIPSALEVAGGCTAGWVAGCRAYGWHARFAGFVVC